jgi:hypothetical protein
VPEAFLHTPSKPAPAITDALAAELSANWRQQVSAEATRRGLDPIETLQGAARQAPAAQRKTLRAVLAGFRAYRPEELSTLWQGDWLPQQWIDAWHSSLPSAESPAGPNGTRAGDAEDNPMEQKAALDPSPPARRRRKAPV